MAEREGFEPPIALRLCLISSQVHSTGLCHLSVFLFCCTYAAVMVPTNCLVVLLEIFSSRRFSHNPPAINRRGLVFWSEMRVPHDHLDVPCPSSSATVRRSTRP